MTAEEFAVWSEARLDGERYELMSGHPVRMQAGKVGHAERKTPVWLAFRTELRKRGLDCRAFVDGVGVRIGPDKVREPDVVVHWRRCEPDDLLVPNPIVTAILGRESRIELDPPGIAVPVESFRDEEGARPGSEPCANASFPWREAPSLLPGLC